MHYCVLQLEKLCKEITFSGFLVLHSVSIKPVLHEYNDENILQS